jgi:hypothetical protein
MVASPMVEPAVVEKPRRGGFWIFVFGFIVGVVALFGLALLANSGNF